MEENLIKALKAKYEFQMADAIAGLTIYIKSPVGVGEHPQITDEIDKMVEHYISSKEKLGAVDEIINKINNSSK